MPQSTHRTHVPLYPSRNTRAASVGGAALRPSLRHFFFLCAASPTRVPPEPPSPPPLLADGCDPRRRIRLGFRILCPACRKRVVDVPCLAATPLFCKRQPAGWLTFPPSILDGRRRRDGADDVRSFFLHIFVIAPDGTLRNPPRSAPLHVIHLVA